MDNFSLNKKYILLRQKLYFIEMVYLCHKETQIIINIESYDLKIFLRRTIRDICLLQYIMIKFHIILSSSVENIINRG